MFDRLTEFILPPIIGVMVHKRERLTEKERAARDAFLAKLDIKERKTKKPIVVAFIGLIGSGKSSVARELADHIGGTVIEGDAIRVELRTRDERYEKTRAIAEAIALEVIARGGNAILDSDFVDAKKRASIREKARRADARLVFVRTDCDFDVAAGRIISAAYHPDDFFGGATSELKEDTQKKGAVVKMREMWRRTPHHYRWVSRDSGKWVLKKFPFAIFAEITTTNPRAWKWQVERCAERLLMQ